MKLSQADIERYAPYHTMTAFEIGYRDYECGHVQTHPFDVGHGQVDQQAYDRGAECAMRHQRAKEAA